MILIRRQNPCASKMETESILWLTCEDIDFSEVRGETNGGGNGKIDFAIINQQGAYNP